LPRDLRVADMQRNVVKDMQQRPPYTHLSVTTAHVAHLCQVVQRQLRQPVVDVSAAVGKGIFQVGEAQPPHPELGIAVTRRRVIKSDSATPKTLRPHNMHNEDTQRIHIIAGHPIQSLLRQAIDSGLKLSMKIRMSIDEILKKRMQKNKLLECLLACQLVNMVEVLRNVVAAIAAVAAVTNRVLLPQNVMC